MPKYHPCILINYAALPKSSDSLSIFVRLLSLFGRFLEVIPEEL